jgi:hypothetical protein
MALRWTTGFTLLPDGGSTFFGRLQVRGQPDVEVMKARLPRELQDVGTVIEIRQYPEYYEKRDPSPGGSARSREPLAALGLLEPGGVWVRPKPRLFVWRDAETRSGVTESASDLKAAKSRAEEIVRDLLAGAR